MAALLSATQAATVPVGSYPRYRPRRLRRTPALRRMVRETSLQVHDLIFPLFIVEGMNIRREISSLPGNYHYSPDMLSDELAEIQELGIPAVLLFGIPAEKDTLGSQAYAADGVVQQAVRAITAQAPELIVITDVCVCEYTDHGHCGVLSATGEVLNDPTLELLARTAISHAEAGADIVAPSDMMDGRVAAIRTALDEHGFTDVAILAYAAKFASAFYGPFREAAQSAPRFGDRKAYQMDPANPREALREVALDVQEGADLLMVKPALPYLDVIQAVRSAFPYPVVAYNVSGEYAMLKAAARMGWLNERQAVLEALTGIKRAGADLIISYHAKDVARWLREG